MKRKWLLLSIAGFFILLIVVALWPGDDADTEAPRFAAGNPSLPVTNDWTHYNWGEDAPFENGRTWLWTRSGTNNRCFLYDLEKQEYLGELFHAGIPEICSRDGSRMLVQGRDSVGSQLYQRLRKKIDSLCGSLGWKKLPSPNRTETFWILDTKNNRARQIGSISQYPGSGSRWHISPDFRRGYTRPTVGYDSHFLLCDVDAETFEKIRVPGDLKGWWDDRNILVETAPNTFALFDIITRKTSVLFSPTSIQSTLAAHGLTIGAASAGTFANWNGHDYDFYFAVREAISGINGRDTFLLKADRTGPSLILVDQAFQFRWGGSFDSTGALYLYQGEKGVAGRGGDGSVYIRRLADGSVTTVIPPDNKGQYSIPRFYRDEVIYFRDRVVRRVRLDGSDDKPLLSVGN